MQRKSIPTIVRGDTTSHRLFCVFSCVLCLVFLLTGPFFVSLFPADAKTPMYIPSTPLGTTFGYVGVDYDYVIITMNPDSFWMFDWGDGTTSDWLQLAENETSIVQTHQWNVPGTYQVHVKFKNDVSPYGVWSNAKLVEITTYEGGDFPHKPILYTGKIQGVVGTVYTYSARTTDPHDFQVCYQFDFGNGTLSSWTPFVPSGTSSYISFAWQKPGVYIMRAQARNQYNLLSDWSDPVQVIIKDTSHDLGESIDLIVLSNITYQILYTSQYNGTLYNPSTGSSNDILWHEGGIFLIDDDSDGRWEYLYIPSIGQIQPYIEPVLPQKDFLSEFPWFLLILLLCIIFGTIGGVLFLIREGYIYFYEEEVTAEK
jgi:hypothetical protein